MDSKLCKVISRYFDCEAEELILLKEKPGRRKVWMLKADGMRYILKWFSKRMCTSPTPVLVQECLWSKRLNVPSVIRSKTGDLYVEFEDGFFYVSEFINHTKERPALEERTAMLLSLHNVKLEDKYTEIKDMAKTKRSFLAKYQMNINLLKKWHNHSSFFAGLSHCIKGAELSLSLIHSFDLNEYFSFVLEEGLLYHGDFNVSNILTGTSGDNYLIDFDKTAVGPQIIDIQMYYRKLFSNNPDEIKDQIAKFYTEYFQKRPKIEKYKALYYFDALFPHRICLVLYKLGEIYTDTGNLKDMFSSAAAHLHHNSLEELLIWEKAREQSVKQFFM
ncbi:phosphotransferase [Peribacillus sp. SCS-26]|uniref:phosphotransferase n=1 Tax=Paraperibacillus marinus TaxID=3115295 RepID=UPI003905E648